MPLAGFSPNCWAVLVQMEHWADAACRKKSPKVSINIRFLIFTDISAKVAAFLKPLPACPFA